MAEKVDFESQNSFIISLMPGEILFRKGVKANSFYFVTAGKLMILQSFTASIIRQYGKGEIFGISEVFSGENWSYMAEAKTFTSVHVFPKNLLFDRISLLPPQPRKIVDSLISAA